MTRVTIYHSDRYDIVSYGNGTAYAIAYHNDGYEVGFHGWPNFTVYRWEVLEIRRPEEIIHVRDKPERPWP